MSGDGTVARKIAAYIERHDAWRKQLCELRRLLLATELEEAVKWGAPCYLLEGKIVIGLVAFKNHCALWFHHGALLRDSHNKLINAQQGQTRGLRQWRFQAEDDIDAALLQAYIEEAIANQRAGKTVAPQPRPLQIPDELRQALDQDGALQAAFDKLTSGRQKEYAEHVGSAKQAKTRLARLAKVTPMILAGVGLNDRYR